MQEYFATLEQARLIPDLQSRIDAYYNWVLMTGRLARWRVAYNTHYGSRGSHNSFNVTAAGEKGELSFLMSNEYRNLVQHTMVMARQSRTALETVSENTDSTSKAQSYVAKGLIEYYRRDGSIDQNSDQAAEISLVMDTGWVFNEWDVTLSTDDDDDATADPDTGEEVRQGDIRSRARTPLDVVIDFLKIDTSLHDWRIVKDAVNKYDLAAQNPEMAEDIVKCQRDLTKDALFRFGDVVNYAGYENGDDIDVWTFYHRKSPALPMGRMFQFIDGLPKALFDGPIPYRRLPGNRICPSEQILSSLGYSNANDLLGLQDVLDAMVSAAVTNMTTCGVNNIWTEPNPNFDFEQIANGMNLIESPKKPEVLVMAQLPREWEMLANWIIGRMEAYMGSNPVARGNIEGKDFSGAAMALLQSMSIQFNSAFTKSLNKLVEDNGNDVIELTQDFVPQERIGMIIGENNRRLMSRYSGKSINKIRRVYCRQSNPMKDTTAGRLTLVQEAFKTEGGLSKAQFAEIIDTGNTDCLLESGRNAELAIDEENEALIRGETPPVFFGENHPRHLQKHLIKIAFPEDKADPAYIARVKAHCDDHLHVWGTTDPNILRALNIPPLIQPPPPPPGVGAPAGPPPPGGPPPLPIGGPPGGGPADGIVGPPNQPPQIKGPNMPTNPLSGQPWNPETGGLSQGAS